MKQHRNIPGLAVASLVLALFAAAPTFATGPPKVFRVEPPNWWAGHSVNPVRVLIHGENLGGASVTAGNGLRVSNVKTNPAGSYLFADVWIDPKAVPGVRQLRITNAAGTVNAPFEISKPLSAGQRFQGFSLEDVIYLIMPDRFSDGDLSNDDPPVSPGLYDRTKSRYYHGGDLQGIINHLSYLKSLGVTAIWLTPVYDNVNRLNEHEQYGEGGITDYHGYGPVDFYGVEEHLGTMDKLRELVDDAHRLGLKVIQDQVANHTGPYHSWVKDSPSPTWFNGTEARHLSNTWQIWTTVDPHATPETSRATLEGWFINILPDLNQNDPEAARYLIQNSLWWIGMAGFDGVREDTVSYVPRAFWAEWSRALKRQYPNLKILGEVSNENPSITSAFQGGRKGFDGIDTGIDTVFDYPLYYRLKSAFIDRRDLRELPEALSADRLYPDPNFLVTFLDLHDVPRFGGERGAALNDLELAQTFLLTARGLPLIYYGDEIAMSGGSDPDNRRDFPGGFPGDKRDAFTATGRTESEARVYEHLRKLIGLRQSFAPLRRGAMADLLVKEHQYAFARTLPGQSAIVVLNNDSKAATVRLRVSSVGIADGTVFNDALGSAPDATVATGEISVEVAADSAVIYVAR